MSEIITSLKPNERMIQLAIPIFSYIHVLILHRIARPKNKTENKQMKSERKKKKVLVHVQRPKKPSKIKTEYHMVKHFYKSSG